MLDINQNTFTKNERLYAQKRIDALFASGESFIAYPLRVVYTLREKDDVAVTVLISVSKKKFKRAVKRNRVKRLVREVYRLNKNELYIPEIDKSIDIAFLYLKNELPSYEEIEKAIKKTGMVLREKLSANVVE